MADKLAPYVRPRRRRQPVRSVHRQAGGRFGRSQPIVGTMPRFRIERRSPGSRATSQNAIAVTRFAGTILGDVRCAANSRRRDHLLLGCAARQWSYLAIPHTDRVTIEIERKFIVLQDPTAARLGPGVHIRQGYLAEEQTVEVRIRITPTNAMLTVLAGTGLLRTEVEIAISVEQADTLWPHTARRRIDKTRHRVMLDDPLGHVAEVDVYAGALAGLCVTEVEFSSEINAAAFTPPAWFGRELTGQPGWSNAALARYGRPD